MIDQTKVGQTEDADRPLSELQEAHQRLKSIRIEYETLRSAGRLGKSNGVHFNILDERYSKAVEEFFFS